MKLSRLFGARKAPFDFNQSKCVQAPPGIAAQAMMIGQSWAGAGDGPHAETGAKLALAGFEGNRIRPKPRSLGPQG